MDIGDLVLYKNNQLIAFNKPAGIGVQPDKTEEKTLVDLAEIYTKSNLYLIHRLDRPASGVVLLAKNKNALAALNQQFKEREIDKVYLAVVKQAPTEREGKLVHYTIKDGKRNKSLARDEAREGSKRAELSYRVLGQSDHYTLLEIKIITGRHHQIRAQLAAIGSPIKGDVKYGARRGNKDRSIQLHAWKLQFRHPVSGEREEVIAPVPDDAIWRAFGVD
jgi:23S rRNA pseudouridine1911/1915/1917 synthase